MTYMKFLLAPLCSAMFLMSGCTKGNLSSDSTIALSNFPVDGASLPYDIIRDDLVDNKTRKQLEIRNGGYGSAMTAHPTKNNQFYALTDRGPNATYTGVAEHNLGKGKRFPVPEYTPRIGLFELTLNGQVRLVEDILLKRPDGTLITGLPNSSALGGTGETPYDALGLPILENPDRPYDPSLNPIRLDDYGLDGEGLVALKDGSFWVSDEYGPHMVHFDNTGREIERINPFTADIRSKYTIPSEFSNRRANRGMEGLAITPDEKVLVGIMQSTMFNPNKSVKNLDLTRIVTVNLETGAIGQYLYRQVKNQNANSEIVALNEHEFLVIERDGSFLNGGPKGKRKANPLAQKHVYRIDLNTGTNLEKLTLKDNLAQNEELGLTVGGRTLEQVVKAEGWNVLEKLGIEPVSKTLVVDMVAEVDYPHDKMEGLWLIDQNRLGVLNDDDFATWSSAGKLEQKMLSGDIIDSAKLYIVDVNLTKKESSE